MRCCAAVKCNNSSRHIDKWKKSICDIHKKIYSECPCAPPFTWHYFPSNTELRNAWVQKVRRNHNGKPWQPKSRESVLCSLHFVEGKPTERYPIPWLNLGYNAGTPKPTRKIVQKRVNTPSHGPPFKKVKSSLGSIPSSVDTVGSNNLLCVENDGDIGTVENADILKDHDYQFKCNSQNGETSVVCECGGCKEKQFVILHLQSKIEELEAEILSLKSKLESGKKTINTSSSGSSTKKGMTSNKPLPKKIPMYERLLTSDKKVRFYTGLPNLKTFNLVFEYMEPKVEKMTYWRGIRAVIDTKRPRKFLK